ncbi:hypothetical protein EJB05_55905, partial [Eragrostis curvula]
MGQRGSLELSQNRLLALPSAGNHKSFKYRDVYEFGSGASVGEGQNPEVVEWNIDEQEGKCDYVLEN